MKLATTILIATFLVAGGAAALPVDPTVEPPTEVWMDSAKQGTTITWTASPTPGVSYAIYRDGVLLGKTTDLDWNDNATDDGLRLYQVRASVDESYSLPATAQDRRCITLYPWGLPDPPVNVDLPACATYIDERQKDVRDFILWLLTSSDPTGGLASSTLEGQEGA
ncbi:MAG: hypothetical protein ACPGQL_06965 [Thermoplasmatota archaeon]